jgi:decaprenylphospho-beta-D-ribofuranose 2-oxidase
VGCYGSVDFHDVSRLETVRVAQVIQVHNVDDIRQAVNKARMSQLKISLAGARHSQGGQSYVTGGIVLDMTGYRRVLHIDPSTYIMTVESGATWGHVQAAANQKDLAVEVMQSSNIFTIGGSLSVNVHGRDPHYGSLINSTIAFRLLTFDGTVKNISRKENSQLFQLVIGGYGSVYNEKKI